MKAMIFAAGLGTRLKPLTDTMPKALVPVSGKPLLWHVANKLHNEGVDDFVINTHHFPYQILEYATGAEMKQAIGTSRVAISDEQPQPLETGGGILKAKAMLDDASHFLVHNTDILSNLDIKAFEDAFLKSGDTLATLLVSERKTQRYLLFNDGLELVGWTNIATGEVKSPFEGLDVSKCRMLAFAGAHVISSKVFDAMKKLGFSGKFGIVDFYLAACATYKIKAYIQPGLRLMDVGKIDTLKEADDFLLAMNHTHHHLVAE